VPHLDHTEKGSEQMGGKKQIVNADRDAYTAGRDMTINQAKSKRAERLEKITALEGSAAYARRNGHAAVERAHSYGEKRLAEFDRQVMRALHPLGGKYRSQDPEDALAHLLDDAKDTRARLQDALDQVISELYELHRGAIGEFRTEISGIDRQLAALGVQTPPPPAQPPALPKMILENDRPPSSLVKRIKAGANNAHYEQGTVYYVADRPRLADALGRRCERNRDELERRFYRCMGRAHEGIDNRAQDLIEHLEDLKAQLRD
jgi:hypothetical protein